MSARLLLRADGNERIGLGHVMRLLALAEIAAEDGADVERVFLTRPGLPAATANELQAAGISLLALPATLAAADEAAWLAQHFRPTDVLVLDGYEFDFAYQSALRAAVGALVYLDDLHAFPQAADVVLNPAGGITAAQYELRRPGARLLTGPAWAPLRAPFRRAALAPAPAANPGTVLLCLGGADPANRTQQLAGTLLDIPHLDHLHIAVGSAYQHLESLTTWASDLSDTRLTIHHALPAEAFCALLQTCGAALTSASTISYEYATTGGLLTVLQTADNQRGLYEFLLREGLARPAAALPNLLSAPDRVHTQTVLRTAQRRQFDGDAPARLRGLLRGLYAQAQLRVRPATAADSALLLDWANDPLVRQFSYQSAPIQLADHEQWLAARLTDPHHLLLVAEVAGIPAGNVRFALDATTGTATLSFLLAPEFRGQRLAPALLLAGVRAAAAHWGTALRRVLGHVQRQNAGSQAAFRRAGFRELTTELTPPDSVSYEWLPATSSPLA